MSTLFHQKSFCSIFILSHAVLIRFIEQLLRVSRSVILKNADKILLVFMAVCYTVSFFVIADG